MAHPHMLKTRYKGGEPLLQYCSPTERNRINNFITGLKGIGCRVIHDPNDYRNCKIIVDGSSDTTTPDGWVAPWSKPCASMQTNTVTTSTGVVAFPTSDHETNDDVLDVDLANNKIIVKEGWSGVYSIKMQAELVITLVDSPPGTASIAVYVRKGGSATKCQANKRIYKPPAGGGVETFVDQFSASIDEFIDASSGDIDLDVYSSISVADPSDQASLAYCRLDVHLIELTKSAT